MQRSLKLATSWCRGRSIASTFPCQPRTSDAARGNNSRVETARLGIAVPSTFDPTKIYPVLVISATSDGGAASSIALMDSYKDAALGRGWVILAADGPSIPKDDSNEWRYAMLNEGLDFVAKRWPQSRNWPYVSAGFSGGGKRAGYIAAMMVKDHYKVIGMLMSGVNQDMASKGLSEYHPNSSAFRRVAIFLSSGSQDTVASPQHHERVRSSMLSSGFRKVRLESFPGGHEVHSPHIETALDWFLTGK
jgi:hypothetical protein